MNKKILCLILSVILPLSLFIPVLAQSTINVDINLENYEITVEGNVGLNSAGHMVTMAISKANVQFPDTETNTEGFTDAIVDFYVTYANEKGDYIFDSFVLYTNSDDYVISVTADNGSTQSVTKYLPSKTQYERIINDVSDGDSDKIFATLEAEKNELLKVSDISVYYSFTETEKKSICAKLEIKEYTSLEGIVDDITELSIIHQLTMSNKNEVLYGYLYADECEISENLNIKSKEILDFEAKKTISVIADFDKLTKTEKMTILSVVAEKPRADLEEFYDKLQINTINYLFAKVDNWKEISAYIERYHNDSLKDLDYTKYSSSSYRAEIDKSLINCSYDSIADLCTYINGYKPQISVGGSSGGGAGGGGGGASGGFGPQIGSTTVNGGAVSTVVPVIPETKPENEPENREEKELFTDIKDYDWAKKEITTLYEKGIISGDGNGSFSPERNVSREEFVKMLVVAVNLKEQKHYDFVDVTVDNWAYPYVMKAVTAGIVKGVTDTNFGTGNSISREDMATLAARVLGCSETVQSSEDFIDTDEISEYAKASVLLMKEKGIIKGYDDGSFRPKALSTRAEAAVIICRILDALASAE